MSFLKSNKSQERAYIFVNDFSVHSVVLIIFL